MSDAVSTTEDTRAIELIRASGVLNPNLTLDGLIDVTRKLAELAPANGTATSAGPTVAASMTFVGTFYVYKQQQI
jgi:hypothetical protein